MFDVDRAKYVMCVRRVNRLCKLPKRTPDQVLKITRKKQKN